MLIIFSGVLAVLGLLAVKCPTVFQKLFNIVFWTFQAALIGYLFWYLRIIDQTDFGYAFVDKLSWEEHLRDERLIITESIIGLELFYGAYMYFLSWLSLTRARAAEIRRITG